MAFVLSKDVYARSRKKMVEEHLLARGIKDPAVLDAMGRVPRHLFVDTGFIGQAYADVALPIGEKQTISQPYIVALMLESLKLTGAEKCLEVGAGSGYQTALLSLLADKVFSIERLSTLAARARRTLDELFCPNVIIRMGDGTVGLPEEAPFDAIIVSAGAPDAPQPLIDQLKTGGRLVMPVGGGENQELIRITKKETGVLKERLCGCRFVKLIGRHGWEE
ncbi:MAG: protein-L-isoaspartate(D-aspartate) O-methyltransferase [Deltaproteobacteria bacterium]|nr:protein-L-isoaspartate(D-aspartate) O-methyltransferase [Deltaproteobacteria bacterium]